MLVKSDSVHEITDVEWKELKSCLENYLNMLMFNFNSQYK